MNIFGLFLFLGILILLFLLFREVVCWYWKINRSVELQEQILEELRKMNGGRKLTAPQAQPKANKRKDASLEVGDVVVIRATMCKATILEIQPDGSYLCGGSDGQVVGTFRCDEIFPEI